MTPILNPPVPVKTPIVYTVEAPNLIRNLHLNLL